jgi:hypothetical protein
LYAIFGVVKSEFKHKVTQRGEHTGGKSDFIVMSGNFFFVSKNIGFVILLIAADENE